MDSHVAVTAGAEEAVKLPVWMDAAQTHESLTHVRYVKRNFPGLEVNLQWRVGTLTWLVLSSHVQPPHTASPAQTLLQCVRQNLSALPERLSVPLLSQVPLESQAYPSDNIDRFCSI